MTSREATNIRKRRVEIEKEDVDEEIAPVVPKPPHPVSAAARRVLRVQRRRQRNKHKRKTDDTRAREESAVVLKELGTQRVEFKTLKEACNEPIPNLPYLRKCYFIRLYDMSMAALAEGWQDDQLSDRTKAELLRQLIVRLRRDRALNREIQTLYKLTGSYAKWNTAMDVYLLECHLLLMLEAYGTFFTDTRKEANAYCSDLGICTLNSLELEISRLTQKQLFHVMFNLATHWNGLECNSQQMPILLDHLHLRAAHLTVSTHKEKVMDCTHSMKKYRSVDLQSNPIGVNEGDPDCLYRCSAEYTCEMSSWFCHFQCSMEMLRYLGGAYKDPEPDPEQPPPFICREIAVSSGAWQDYSVKEGVDNLNTWLMDELNTLQDGRFNDSCKKELISFSLRPAEAERYTRAKNGLRAADNSAVLELCRTAQQVSYWIAMFDHVGVKFIMEKNMGIFKGLLHNVLCAMVTDFALQRRMKGKFSWWANCILFERDFFGQLAMLQIFEEPIMLMCMGEVNVYFAKKLYRTRTFEHAMLMWSILIVEKRKSEFTIDLIPHSMVGVAEMLRNKWCPESYEDKQLDMMTDTNTEGETGREDDDEDDGLLDLLGGTRRGGRRQQRKENKHEDPVRELDSKVDQMYIQKQETIASKFKELEAFC